MATAADVLKMIQEKEVKFVDLRFTDPRGKWQHVTFDIGMIDEEIFAEGTMFDGSSIAGWKAINESDMCLMPDPVTATIDPFFAETTMVITCDVLEPTTGEPYNRDPRGIAKKAMAHMKSQGVGDTCFFGPEAEFFVFDDVRFKSDPYNTGFVLDSIELPPHREDDLADVPPAGVKMAGPNGDHAKIVESGLKTYYKEVCLLEQPFVKDPDMTVAKYVEESAKQLGAMEVVKFVRFEKGEGIEKKQEDFAAEVAKALQG